MPRALLALLVPVVLAGCAASDTDLAARERSALERELAGRVAGQPRSCVPAGSSHGLEIVGERTLVYRRAGTVWVNRPLTECAGFRPVSALRVETTGSQYCRGDHVQAIELDNSIPGPTCVLGDFVPYRRPANG